MTSDDHINRLRYIGAVAVAGAALATRVPALGYGLPYLWHPDEPTSVYWSTRMAETNSPMPHFYDYPSFMFDVLALVDKAHRLTSPHVPPDGGIVEQGMGIGRTSDPDLWLAFRSVTMVFSVGLCLICYLVVLRATGRVWAALLAGGLMAVSPLVISNGVFITTDTYSGFFAAAALAGSLAVLRRGRAVDYALAGAAAGLAFGSKYNAAVAVVPVLVAHSLRYGRGAFTRRGGLPRLVLATVSGALVLLATTPAILFDSHEFVRQSLMQLSGASQHHAGAEREAWPFYLSTLWHDEPVPVVALVLSLWTLRGSSREHAALPDGTSRPAPLTREAIVIWSYAAGYLGLIDSQHVSFSRYVMPLEPALAILTALAAVDLSRSLTSRRPRVAVIGAVMLAALVPPAVDAASVPTVLGQNPRYEAAAWIEARVPHGSEVIVEQYGPWLDPHDYRVIPANQVIAGPLPRHAAAIVVTASGAQWLTDGAVPSSQAAAFDRLTASYCRRAGFTDGAWISILTPC